MLGLINNLRYDRLDKTRQYSFKTDLENHTSELALVISLELIINTCQQIGSRF